MKVGIPKGLLYYKYFPFIKSFYNSLGVEIITSPDTNKSILNEGVKYAIDEACLPIKVFHGHVASIKDKCDLMVIPRIMTLRPKEYICPKFCGLPEMIINSIPNMPPVTTTPINTATKKELYDSCKALGSMITKDKIRINEAFEIAYHNQLAYKSGYNHQSYKRKIALIGHPYNLYDKFINMDVVKKLNALGIGVITEEHVTDEFIDEEVSRLFKKPFWTFARNSYGFASYLLKNKKIDGIVYISSFACGIDSVVMELIKDNTENFPFLILKIDEHTGEAGFDTRIEAFADMLERRNNIEGNVPSHG